VPNAYRDFHLAVAILRQQNKVVAVVVDGRVRRKISFAPLGTDTLLALTPTAQRGDGLSGEPLSRFWLGSSNLTVSPS
jgi:hypothetical protein